MRSPAPDIDTIITTRRGISGVGTFNPSRGVINSFLTTGRMDLLENQTLKYQLANWNDVLIDYQEAAV